MGVMKEVAHCHMKGFKNGKIRAGHVTQIAHDAVGKIRMRDCSDVHKTTNNMANSKTETLVRIIQLNTSKGSSLK
jgi:hypothetical protein